MNQWLTNFLDTSFGFIDKLKVWSRTQRLFLYSILVTVFLVLFFIVLPRYDCTQLKIAEACKFIQYEYAKKIK